MVKLGLVGVKIAFLTNCRKTGNTEGYFFKTTMGDLAAS
jgi:hypothetical protein